VRLTAFAWALCWLVNPQSASGQTDAARSPDAIRFDRDIRPILSDNCFACHGPDAAERKSGLRLDVRDAALAPADSGQRAIVPNQPGQSELLRRVLASDESVVMPPPETNKKLSATEKAKLKKWVEQGALWSDHWSLVPPKRPATPPVSNETWIRNDIDRFVLARLDAEGLKPSREADKTTLLRRVTLDLTGLPPTLAEIDAFLADQSPDAFDKVVDRLLASPQYGERMALEWLDAARYADTHGYHIDSHRDMWPWRDWVIKSFNRNQPFDQFTIEQLAGDLLPEATLDQRIASGFNRNHMINFEGGAIPEEYHTAYIVDRVNTLGTVWMGLTIGCTQCHDHKYDPLTQKEFYQLYAFFHHVPEKGLDGRKGNAEPIVKVSTPQQQQQLDTLAAAISKAKSALTGPLQEVDAAQTQWEQEAAEEKPIDWVVLEPVEVASQGGATLTALEDHSVLASGANPKTDIYTARLQVQLPALTAIRLETLPDDSFNGKGPGRSVNGNLVLTEVRVLQRMMAGQAERPIKLKESSADYSQKSYAIAAAIDGKPSTGWAIYPEVGKPHAAVFEFDQPIEQAEPVELTVVLEFQSEFAEHQAGRFRLAVTNSTDPHGKQALSGKLREILARPASERSEAEAAELRDYYRKNVSPLVKKMSLELAELEKQQAELEKQIPTAMVMQEMPQPRDTFLLIRGQYDKPGEKVEPGVPAVLPPLPSNAPRNRLGLARWLVDPGHPLTSRVIVNRYWQMYFGTGLVRTSEDFGLQGEWPSHPQLLDWLATEFISSGWDVKHMQRLIVTSATYRQASTMTGELTARDPDNRLLARGPRFRLQAEFIRDQALAASGLLNGAIGGPSVYPYQPPGLWEELAFGKEFTAQSYVQSHGQDLYRRSMYTFWKRTVPPATMSTFDAPDRETCTVRRLRTNTPLQALVLMNDPTYIEAARKLAERVLTVADSSNDGRIELAFRLLLARRPKPRERDVLRSIYEQQLTVYRRDKEGAAKLLSVGESSRNSELDTAELAAWTTVVSAIINLDETITKG
jgi:hypothetical protein